MRIYKTFITTAGTKQTFEFPATKEYRTGVLRIPNQSLLFSTGAACFSPCERYRFTLSRWFKSGIGMVNFIMLNPSTATAEEDDPTIRRCIGFARAWNAAELVVTNLFAFRATDPRALRRVADPVGPGNDDWLLDVAKAADRVVCAWGNHGRLNGRGVSVAKILRDAGVELHALKVTKAGEPQHPLYLSASCICSSWATV